VHAAPRALLAKSVAGLTATLRLRVGGTINTVDGTIRATAAYSAAATAFAQQKDATPPAAFSLAAADAGSGALVKLTLQASGGAAGDSAQVRGASVVLSG